MTEYGAFTHAHGANFRQTLCGQAVNDGKRRLFTVFPREFGALRTPPKPWCPACEAALAQSEVPA